MTVLASGPIVEPLTRITVHAGAAGGTALTVTLEEASNEDLDTGPATWATVKAITVTAGNLTVIDAVPAATITARRPLRINIGGTVTGWKDLTVSYEVKRALSV